MQGRAAVAPCFGGRWSRSRPEQHRHRRPKQPDCSAARRSPVSSRTRGSNCPTPSYYIADLYWRELRAILEIDSREYHFSPADWRATMDRHLVLTTLGYSVVHRPPSALADPATFVRDVSAWLTGRAAARNSA